MIKENKKLMEQAAKSLNFIEASIYRDNQKELKNILLTKNKY